MSDTQQPKAIYVPNNSFNIKDVQPMPANQANQTITLKGAGEPHFVGFDGIQFDYHGVKDNDYLIYDDGNIKVIARFTEPDLSIFPDFVGQNFMSKIVVNGYKITFDSINDKDVTEEEVVQVTGFARGLSEELQFINGKVTKMDVVEFAKGRLIVTLMELPQSITKTINDTQYIINNAGTIQSNGKIQVHGTVRSKIRSPNITRSIVKKGELKCFNLQLDLLEMPKEATGILGQTLLPPSLRKSNDVFRITTKV